MCYTMIKLSYMEGVLYMNKFIVFMCVLIVVTFLLYYFSYKRTNLNSRQVKKNSIIATILDLFFWF